MTEKGMLATRRDDPNPTINWNIVFFHNLLVKHAHSGRAGPKQVVCPDKNHPGSTWPFAVSGCGLTSVSITDASIGVSPERLTVQ
jgi:hypothetical protein